MLTCTAPRFSQAQQQPDAGHTSQELNSQIVAPKSSSVPSFTAPATPKNIKSGGAIVQIKSIELNGNSVISDQALLAILDIEGKEYDFAGLQNLARKITDFYHQHDYPFARAILPAQTLAEGKLKIEIIEGRYGKVSVSSDDTSVEYQESAQEYLSVLNSGSVIKGSELETICLILDDQPGFRVIPVVKPGENIGLGDLVVNIRPDKPYGGSVNLDNKGNRYTGSGRIQLDGYLNSPFIFGDKLDTSLVYTEENMWFGSLSYSLPLLYPGLRGNIGLQHTDYQLGKEFTSLDAHGTADILSLGLNYPLMRSQKQNISLFTTYQRKWLVDKQGATATKAEKSSNLITTALNFDFRDLLGGGGVTYGSISWTHGFLDLDDGLYAIDNLTAHTDGVFDKINFDVRRINNLPIKYHSLYVRITGQKAFENLDSSEDFGLGGPNGVRAYPVGESYGDEGILSQIELRRVYNTRVSSYLFFDYGYTRTNHTPWTTLDNGRTIGGAGLGFQYTFKNIEMDTTVAWRTVGGPPQSDSRITTPTFWLNMSYNF